MNRPILVAILAASFASAQRSEIGGVLGGGVVGAEDLLTAKAVVVGAEFCGLCSGRLGVFGEFNHLETFGRSRTVGISRFDIVGGGLRIQGGQRVRPFFDIGAIYGVDQFAHGSHGNPGVVLAGGVAVRLRERFYIRPQFRTYVLRGMHAVAVGTAGFGIRF